MFGTKRSPLRRSRKRVSSWPRHKSSRGTATYGIFAFSCLKGIITLHIGECHLTIRAHFNVESTSPNRLRTARNPGLAAVLVSMMPVLVPNSRQQPICRLCRFVCRSKSFRAAGVHRFEHFLDCLGVFGCAGQCHTQEPFALRAEFHNILQGMRISQPKMGRLVRTAFPSRSRSASETVSWRTRSLGFLRPRQISRVHLFPLSTARR